MRDSFSSATRLRRRMPSMPLPHESSQALYTVGWRDDLPLPADAAPASRLARVIIQHRNGYVLSDGANEFAAQPAPRFLRRRAAPDARPAVGDFVLVDAATPAVIQEVLPRRTVLARAAAGERYARQVIATNIDPAFVLMGLDGDFNPRRIERYLLLIAGSGVRPVIVLTKADLIADAARHSEIAALRAQLPPDIELHALNAKDVAAVAPLLRHLQRGDSAVLLGSSGAGKSTLTNTLLGRERQATSTVREHDSRGRHTTTHRALIALPSGGCLIDTPGMRELKLTGDARRRTGVRGARSAGIGRARSGALGKLQEASRRARRRERVARYPTRTQGRFEGANSRSQQASGRQVRQALMTLPVSTRQRVRSVTLRLPRFVASD